MALSVIPWGDRPRPFWAVITERDDQKLRELLDAGLDPKGHEWSHNLFLNKAVCDGSIESIRLLLKAGANPLLLDEFYGTAVHAACVRSDNEALDIILKAGGDPNVPCRSKVSPLEMACSRNSYDKVIMLLSAGADRFIQCRDLGNKYMVPLTYYCTIKMEKLLQSWPAVVTLWTLCIRCVYKHQVDTTDFPPLLLEYPDELSRNIEEKEEEK